jgi:tetratricopeptide (TPR) repeat protein
MARASAKRGGRPRPNARQRGQREQPVARTEAPKRPSYEDQLFFTRLRRKTKWVFALLAVAFAIGFIVFGVGTGVNGANIGDFFRDIFGGGSSSTDAPAVADALQAVEDHPNDPDAIHDLANAYRQAGQNKDAAATLEKYVSLKPSDGVALRELTAVYLQLAVASNQRLQALLAAGGNGYTFSSQAFTFPESSGFLSAVGDDPAEAAIDSGYSRLGAQLQDEVQSWSRKRAAAFEKLATATPDDPTVLFQLGQAWSSANENEKAIDAYRRYLAADPNGDYAEAAQKAVDDLRGADTATG